MVRFVLLILIGICHIGWCVAQPSTEVGTSNGEGGKSVSSMEASTEVSGMKMSEVQTSESTSSSTAVDNTISSLAPVTMNHSPTHAPTESNTSDSLASSDLVSTNDSTSTDTHKPAPIEYNASGELIPQLAPDGVVLMDTNPPMIPPLPVNEHLSNGTSVDEPGNSETVHEEVRQPDVDGPKQTLESKLDELLAMSDEDLGNIPKNTPLTLLQTHLALARLKDQATSLKTNEIQALRTMLESLQKEHRALLLQQWNDEERKERDILEGVWFDSENRREQGYDETQNDIGSGATVSTPFSHSIGYVALIVVGSVAAGFLLFALFMFIRTFRRSSHSDNHTYELHQSLNGNV